jgi:hypothetical protein
LGGGWLWMQAQGTEELPETPVLTSPETTPDPPVVEPVPEPAPEPEPEPPEPEPVVAELSPEGETKPQADPDRGKAKATPTPVPDPEQPGPATSADGPPFGKWQVSGAAGGLGYVELTVRGSPERVKADWTAFAGGQEAKTPLSGKYDPETGRLNLSSSNGRDLKLTLFLSGDDLQGEYSRQTPTGATGGHIDFKAAQ